MEGRAFDEGTFRDHMAHRLARFGCGQDKIASRGHEVADCSNTRWSEMQVYRLDEQPTGVGALARTRFFTKTVEGVLDRLYSECETPPADLLHVTCTGYDSPSAAQRLVASKGWGAGTRVFHVYHMGCYAAFPALRAAGAFAASTGQVGPHLPRRIDVVHTEICSLHLSPLAHSPEQLVVQTLFADGFIAYGVGDEASWDHGSPALELLAQDEQIVPDSTDTMTWTCSDWGMQMGLLRDVPERIAGVLAAFVDRLAQRAGLGNQELGQAVYAVHPGGPKILDRAREVLRLEEAQLACSRKILLERGNMSSATLPHVWMELLRDTQIAAGRTIVSLAFGPGLTLCGAIMRKVTR
jgi:predicted naringenin-chalcone synthase